MTARPLLTLFLVVAYCPALHAQRPPKNAKAGALAKSKFYELILDFGHDEIAKATLKDLDRVWPVTMTLLGVKKAAPRKPLRLHLYRTVAAYEAAEARLTKGRFKKNLAFSHHATKSGHVALQPTISDETMAIVGVPPQTRSLLVHEAAHLAVYAAMRNYASHPAWFTEGVTTWVEAQVCNHRPDPAPGRASSQPRYSDYEARARKILDDGSLPGCEQLLADQYGKLEGTDRYAVQLLFFRYLKEHHDRGLGRLLARARQLGGGVTYGKRLAKDFKKHLGKPEAIDQGLAKYITGLHPEWRQPLRALAKTKDGWLQIAFPDTNAVAHQVAPVGKSDYLLRGTLRFLPAKSAQMNLLLDCTASGMV
ncbi:MAG: hypothetical protein V3U11_02400, partial [Planctomycetota bacterium]